MQLSDSWPEGATVRPTEDLCHTRESVAPLQIRCFGLLSVTCFGRTIDRWPRRKPRELLAFLASRPGMSATRQELTAALWPTYDHLSADHLLRTTLWQLRRHLAEMADTALVATEGLCVPDTQAQQLARALHEGRAVRRVGERYALDPDLCDCDLHAVRVSLGDLQSKAVDGQSRQPYQSARWLALAEQALRPLLHGESFVWLPALRRELQAVGLVGLTRAIDAARSSGDIGLALEAATRRVAVDPTHEETVEVAMRLHLDRGSAAAAAACYRSLCAALARRYESVNPDLARPSGALRALYRSLAAEDMSEDAPPHPSPSPPGDEPFASTLGTYEAAQRVVTRDGVSSARVIPTSMHDSLAVRPQSAPAPRVLYNQRPASQHNHGWRTRGGIPVYLGLLSVAVLLGLTYAVGSGPAEAHAAPATSTMPLVRASAPFATAAGQLAATLSPAPTASPSATPAPITTPAPTPIPTPMPSSNPGTNSSSGNSWGLPGLPDPGQWVQQALSAAFTAIASGLLSGLRNILDWAMGLHTSSVVGQANAG